MRRVFRDIADINPQESNNKLATYKSWFAPFPPRYSSCFTHSHEEQRRSPDAISLFVP